MVRMSDRGFDSSSRGFHQSRKRIPLRACIAAMIWLSDDAPSEIPSGVAQTVIYPDGRLGTLMLYFEFSLTSFDEPRAADRRRPRGERHCEFDTGNRRRPNRRRRSQGGLQDGVGRAGIVSRSSRQPL